MGRTLLLLLLTASTLNNGFTQNSATLHVNDVQMQVHSNGYIGPQTPNSIVTGFTVPADSSTKVLSASGLWMGGLSSDSQLKFAAHVYNDEKDFFPGPLTVDGSASISPEVSLQYDRLWSITAEQIALHRAYFACAEDPECDLAIEFPNGYEIPSDILSWPAEGDMSAGQALYLAPFTDHNANGTYDPENGDHPCTAGDAALYTIFNDKLEPHLLSGGGPIGVEIHMMPFAYNIADPALQQTVFVHYRIINRGTLTLSNFRIGNFADFDIGCSNDDIVGTDVGRNMVYAYNGDDFDDPLCQGATGFGAQPPAFGMVVLSGPYLDADGTDNITSPAIPAFNGRGFNDGLIDNERHGLDRSMYYTRDGNTFQTDPSYLVQFNSYMNGHWKDGSSLAYGGNGYDLGPDAVPSAFMYPGNTDPLGLGTNGQVQTPWSADLAQNSQDPRALAIMGPITLEPGAVHEILLAYVYARAAEGGALASVAALQQRVDSIAAFAETIPGLMAGGTPCDGLITSGIRDRRMENASLSLFPVPTSQVLSVRTQRFNPGALIEIFDAQGKRVSSSRTTGIVSAIDVLALSPGLYTVRIAGSGTAASGRFVKE